MEDREIMGVANKFRHHPPEGDQAAQYELLRAEGLDFAMVILGECPLSEERNIALRRLDEAVMFAIASIARHSDCEKGEGDTPRCRWDVC